MSWESWGWQRYNAADEFLRTGRWTGPFIPSHCSTSSDCAIGWACINGECKQLNGPGGNNQGFPPPAPPPAPGVPPAPGGPCGDGPDVNQGCSVPGPGGCRTTTCGDGDTRADCCGARCCRYLPGVDVPVVNCWCGDCPGIKKQKCGEDALGNDILCPSGQVCNGDNCQDPDWCVKFCDDYYKTNGEHFSGCRQDNACNECQECSGSIEDNIGVGRQYCKNKSNAPCHCKAPSGCYQCNNDGTAQQTPCQQCCSASASCGDGKGYTFTRCVPVGSTQSACSLAQQAAIEWKNKTCPAPPGLPPGTGSDCIGTCFSTSLCYPSGNPEDGPPDPGSPWRIVKNNGYVRNDETGEICWFLDLCDTKDLSSGCRECGCNANEECGQCKRCDETTCTCVPDESCGNIRTTWAIIIPNVTVCSMLPQPNCGPNSCNDSGGSMQIKGSACGPAPHYLERVREGECITNNVIINGCNTKTVTEETTALYKVYDGNGNKILDITGNGPCGWAGGAHPSTGIAGNASPFILETEPC